MLTAWHGDTDVCAMWECWQCWRHGTVTLMFVLCENVDNAKGMAQWHWCLCYVRMLTMLKAWHSDINVCTKSECWWCWRHGMAWWHWCLCYVRMLTMLKAWHSDIDVCTMSEGRALMLVLCCVQMLHHTGSGLGHVSGGCSCRTCRDRKDGDCQGHGPLPRKVCRCLQLLRSDGLQRTWQNLQR